MHVCVYMRCICNFLPLPKNYKDSHCTDKETKSDKQMRLSKIIDSKVQKPI